jgi:hypothetical protein
VASLAVGRAGHSLRRPVETRYSPLPTVRRIELADLRDVLARGLSELRGVQRRVSQSATYDDPDSVPARAYIQVAERIRSMARAHELPAFERYPPRNQSCAKPHQGSDFRIGSCGDLAQGLRRCLLTAVAAGIGGELPRVTRCFLPFCRSSVPAVAHGSADVRACEADVLQHGIVHGPQLPHVAPDA